MILRPYQKDILERSRMAFRDQSSKNIQSVCIQLATGAGKTAIFSEITRLATENKNLVWVLVPRDELLYQASEQLKEINVNHGMIRPGYQESRAFNVHVVSHNTLIRRWDKIKRPPKIAIIDEAHLFYDRQLEIRERLPDTLFLGVTATPERLDGRGLSEIYDILIQGPSIQELVELGFLKPMSYFAPPIEGIRDLHYKGQDYDPDELEQLFQKRKIYGKAIEHYRKHADGKSCLVFCRSVKAASDTAQRFCDAGYQFENIDGTMSYKKRKILIQALRDGNLQGLTNCEIVCFGLDIPRVECIIMLRPTLSKSLYYQQIGRGLRPYPGKEQCIILDHVGNLQEHCKDHPLEPHEWQFHGREKRRRRKDENQEARIRLCIEAGYLYCAKTSCIGCEHNTAGRTERKLEVIDGSLAEIKTPTEWQQRPSEEKQEYVDRINQEIQNYNEAGINGEIAAGPVGELLKIAEELGRNPLWVYWRLCENRKTINVTLLHEIARQKNYKPGWVWYQKKMIGAKLRRGG